MTHICSTQTHSNMALITAVLMATSQLISNSVYAALLPACYCPPLLLSPVTFLYGNIVCYEQHNSSFIVHDGMPAALIIFFNEIVISNTYELGENAEVIQLSC